MGEASNQHAAVARRSLVWQLSVGAGLLCALALLGGAGLVISAWAMAGATDGLVELRSHEGRSGSAGIIRRRAWSDDPAREMSVLARRQVWAITVAGACMAASAVVIGVGLARRVIPQIARVRRLAHSAGADVDVPIDNVRDEVELLSRHVDQMRSALRGGREELLAKNASLERARQDLLSQARDLDAACRAAKAASAAKSAFLANMSHEIRTPMMAILGYADLLNDPESSVEQRRQFAATIKSSGDHLLAIINDILDLSKIEANQMNIEQLPSTTAALLADVQRLMRSRAQGKGLVLEVEFENPIPATIITDPVRLKQILVNLVGNAVKFTESGGVRVLVRLIEPRAGAMGGTPSEGGPGQIRFEVLDTGIGMSVQQTQRIFTPFTQGDASTTRRFGGTGLGLAISKELAGLLGGRLTVSSTPGEGSSFVLTIPCGSTEGVERLRGLHDLRDRAGDPAATMVQALLGTKILVADDGPENRRLLSHFLSRAGAVVELACTGREAVDAGLRALGTGEPFDVILMDMQMPELDGYDATRELRTRGYGAPIVALTAHAMADDRTRCIRAGCDEYASKPVDRAKLVALCRRFSVRAPASEDTKRRRAQAA